MNAALKPIPAPLERPSYGGYWLVRRNDKEAWIVLNADLLAQWYFQLGATLDDLCVEGLDTFCDAQWDIERAKYEEMKADGRYDDGRLSEE